MRRRRWRKTLRDDNGATHLCGCMSRGCGDSDHVGFIGAAQALDTIARGQEGVESRNQCRMSLEQRGYSFNDAGSIDTILWGGKASGKLIEVHSQKKVTRNAPPPRNPLASHHMKNGRHCFSPVKRTGSKLVPSVPSIGDHSTYF